jgi:hypothetical protein
MGEPGRDPADRVRALSAPAPGAPRARSSTSTPVRR